MITVSLNDYGYVLTDILQDNSGTVFDLTNYNVKFHVWKSKSPGVYTVNANATVITANAGTVNYTVQSGDFANTGFYVAEWEATKTGIKQSFPTPGFTIQVKESA